MRVRLRATTWTVAATMAVTITGMRAQNPAPADAAARLTGTWTLNRELSPGFRAPSGRPGGPGRGGAMMAAAPRVMMMQRRGGSGGSGAGGDTPNTAADMSPAELAAMQAMRQLQQLADEVTIAATAEKITFVDARGERTYTIDGKNAKIMVGTAEVNTKAKWDKGALKQEFSTTSSKLLHTWEVNADGRLLLTARIESLQLRTPDQKAVFDKKTSH